MAEQTVNAKRKSAPVSSHPLFPAIVALWFAALFGLGSLAIRPTLLEAFVLKTHLDAVIAAAAPPLGVTARIILALTLAVAGGLAGAAIAKRITRPRAEARERKRGASIVGKMKLRARDSHPDAPARVPISAHEEIGGSQIESAEPAANVTGRRRSLAIRDEGARADFHDFAPLPGGAIEYSELQVFDLTEVAVGEYTEAQAEPAAAPTAEPRQVFGQPQIFAAAPVDFPSLAEPTAESTAAELTPLPDIAVPSGSAAEQIIAAPLDSLGLVALTERFALSLQRRRDAAELAAAAATTAAELAATNARTEQLELAEATAAPIARMGLPEVAAPRADAPTVPMAWPASLRPLNFDEPADEDIDDYASFLPLRRMTMPVAPAIENAEVVEDAVVEQLDIESALETEVASDENLDQDDGYSSLLELSQPIQARQQFIRIAEPEVTETEIEPVVIFPGQAARISASPEPVAPVPSEVTTLRRFDAPTSAAAGQPVAASAPVATAPDAEETERALRAALATLQRMSGAA